ncbi:MAG: hypothetical protein PUC96_06465 [Bacteroidales bacterium]|nr:hypothetical protein [Bacteroidales bacterium]
MNFIFISPNFPHSYWNFCDRLKKRGVNVLGIGDASYESLLPELKGCLTEYFRVDSLSNYEQVYKAVAYFAFRYGKVDWIESNNEFWLEQDAALRTDFNIKSGVQSSQVASFKSKAAMKPFYAAAGVPTARQIKLSDLAAAKEFISEAGYPVIVKPEIGVGAEATYKISDDKTLEDFFSSLPSVPYVMEEFVCGDIYSYDAIIDSEGNPLFESSAHFPPSVMDVVLENLDMAYYVLDKVPEQLRRRGRATAKAFGVRSRFVHFEFFRLDKAKKGLGRKGDFIGLEVNMRPAGGYTPDMMNFAHSLDVYSIWADMIAGKKASDPDAPSPESYEDLPGNHFCLYYGRRDESRYAHSDSEVLSKYFANLAMHERMPKAISGAMGNQMYTLHAYSQQELDEMIAYLSEKAQLLAYSV